MYTFVFKHLSRHYIFNTSDDHMFDRELCEHRLKQNYKLSEL
jgi:hypothetical protein